MIVARISPDRLRERAKDLRKAREAAGAAVTLPISGSSAMVDTAREDITALLGALVRAESGLLSFPIGWKGGGAFYDIEGPADLAAVAQAASDQVQSAYDGERAALAAIDAGEAITVAHVSAAFALGTGEGA